MWGLLRVIAFTKTKALRSPALSKFLEIEYTEQDTIKSINNKLDLLPVCHKCGKNALLWANPKKDVVIFACSVDCLKLLEDELSIIDFARSKVYFDKKSLKQISRLNLIGRVFMIVLVLIGVSYGVYTWI